MPPRVLCKRQLASKLLFSPHRETLLHLQLVACYISSLQQRPVPPSPLPGQQPVPTLVYRLELILLHVRIRSRWQRGTGKNPESITCRRRESDGEFSRTPSQRSVICRCMRPQRRETATMSLASSPRSNVGGWAHFRLCAAGVLFSTQRRPVDMRKRGRRTYSVSPLLRASVGGGTHGKPWMERAHLFSDRPLKLFVAITFSF
jgi:hypothetical protein